MALGAAKDSSRLQGAIEFAMTDKVRNQDKLFVFMTSGGSNPSFACQSFLEHQEKFQTSKMASVSTRVQE